MVTTGEGEVKEIGTLDGLIEVMVGIGLACMTWKVSALEAPPPGVGFETVT